MKKPSEAQMWARRRNFEKGTLTGILTHLNNLKTLTPVTEKTEVEFAAEHVENVLKGWDEKNSISKKLWMGKV